MVLIGEKGISSQCAFEQALLLGRAAKVLARFQNSPEVEAEAAYLIGRAAINVKQPELAKTNLSEALDFYKREKNYEYAQDALLSLAGVAFMHDSDIKLATSYYEAVIDLKDGDNEKVAAAHLGIGQMLKDNDVDKAILHLQKTLEHLKDKQGRKTAWTYGIAFGSLTECYLKKSDIALARRSVENAREYAHLSGSAFLNFPRGLLISHVPRKVFHCIGIAQLAVSTEDRTGGVPTWMTSLVSAASISTALTTVSGEPEI